MFQLTEQCDVFQPAEALFDRIRLSNAPFCAAEFRGALE